jgi:hypothetical protein
MLDFSKESLPDLALSIRLSRDFQKLLIRTIEE